MRYMVIRKADKDTEAGMAPSEELIQAMQSYVEELVNAGVMLMGEGLKPSSKGARVKFHGGKPMVIDGPFAETKELFAGVSIYQADSLEAVIEMVKRWPQIDGGGEVEIEIREMYELEDFGDGEGIRRFREVGWAEPN